jgi:hypothetical protein
MTSSPPDYVELLYEALNSPLGLVVTSSDPVRLRAKLYEVMRTDDAFQFSLHISRLNPGSDLLILKKAASDDT